MADISDRTTRLQFLIDRLRAGEEATRQELFTSACEWLTRKMLKGQRRLKG